jgi:hypothetical protein
MAEKPDGRGSELSRTLIEFVASFSIEKKTRIKHPVRKLGREMYLG